MNPESCPGVVGFHPVQRSPKQDFLDGALGHSSRNLDLLLLLATKPSWTVSGKPLQSRLIHRHTTFFGSGLFLNLKFKDLEQSSPTLCTTQSHEFS
jgi:hypothetical protein